MVICVQEILFTLTLQIDFRDICWEDGALAGDGQACEQQTYDAIFVVKKIPELLSSDACL